MLLFDPSHLTELLNKLLIVSSPLLDILQRFVVVLTCQSFKVTNEFLHVLKLAVKLFDRFRVLLLFVLDFACVRLHESFVDGNQLFDVLLLVLGLDNSMDFAHKVTNSLLVLASPRLFLV